jgi:hypothetical protein
MSIFKKKEEFPFEKKRDKFEELKKANEKPKDALIIEVKNGCIDITGKSAHEDDREEWKSFLKTLEENLVVTLKEITINIKVNLFNTSQGQYPTIMCNILLINNRKCKSIINWHYDSQEDDDEGIYGHGLILKNNYPQLEINLIEVK